MKISVNNLAFKTLQSSILEGVTFELESCSKNAIYGPQGSGKKVLLLILGGYLKPNSGSVYFNDLNILKNLKQHRQSNGLGEIVKINPLIEELTVRENIEFCAGLVKMQSVEKHTEGLLKKFNLEVFADTLVKDIAHLQRSVLSVVCASLGQKKIIFLDEPTASLTTAEVQKFWEIINANREDKTLFFTTKNETEAHAQAERVVRLEYKKATVE